MRIVKRTSLAVSMLALIACCRAAHANLILNGDFETGTFANWTVFTLPNGSLGPSPLPDVALFDVTGSGESYAARFRVGNTLPSSPGVIGGGGIRQSVTVGAGLLVSVRRTHLDGI